MCRIPAFFMVTLLLFSITRVGLAQQHAAQTQAEADAIRDINRDMKKSLWFMSGLVSSSVGCAAGATGGFLCGAIVGSVTDSNCISFLSDDPLWGCTVAGSIFLGVLTVPTAIFIYPHNPNPPLERLLGKPLNTSKSISKSIDHEQYRFGKDW